VGKEERERKEKKKEIGLLYDLRSGVGKDFNDLGLAFGERVRFSFFLSLYLYLFLMASPKNALILYNFNSYNKVSGVESQHLDTLARLGCSGRMHLEKIPEGKIDKKMRNP
jgi:hypothetical protein